MGAVNPQPPSALKRCVIPKAAPDPRKGSVPTLSPSPPSRPQPPPACALASVSAPGRLAGRALPARCGSCPGLFHSSTRRVARGPQLRSPEPGIGSVSRITEPQSVVSSLSGHESTSHAGSGRAESKRERSYLELARTSPDPLSCEIHLIQQPGLPAPFPQVQGGGTPRILFLVGDSTEG